MKQASVISVNPGQKTLGALHKAEAPGRVVKRHVSNAAITGAKALAGLTPSVREEIIRHDIPVAKHVAYHRKHRIINMILPTRRSGFGMSVAMFIFRAVFAGLLIWRGTTLATSASLIGIGIGASATFFMFYGLAVLMFFGIATRPASAIGTVMFAVLSWLMINTPIDEINMLLGAISVIVCIIGPGWFSIDAFTRIYLIKKLARERQKLESY